MGNNYKPILFIGSSSEAKEVMTKISKRLSYHFEVKQWDKFFEPGDTTLIKLISSIPEYDYAVMLFTPEDKVTSREKKYYIARDNVQFETGLFMSVLGPKRVFIIEGLVEEGLVESIPNKRITDMDGLNRFFLNIPMIEGKPNYHSLNLDSEIDRVSEGIIHKVKQQKNSQDIRDLKTVYFNTQKFLNRMIEKEHLDFEIPILKWRIETEHEKYEKINIGHWEIIASNTFPYMRLIFKKLLETLKKGDEFCTVTNLKFWSEETYNVGGFYDANIAAINKGVSIKRVMIVQKKDLEDPEKRQQLKRIISEFKKRKIENIISFHIYDKKLAFDAYKNVPYVTVKRTKNNKKNGHDESFMTIMPVMEPTPPKMNIYFKRKEEDHKECMSLFKHCYDNRIDLQQMEKMLKEN